MTISCTRAAPSEGCGKYRRGGTCRPRTPRPAGGRSNSVTRVRERLARGSRRRLRAALVGGGALLGSLANSSPVLALEPLASSASVTGLSASQLAGQRVVYSYRG